MSPSTLRRPLYSLSFIDEFGPVYAVYTLWFNDNGVTTAQISTAFIAWAVFALVLEIPSGALADRVDRRHLLAAAFGVRAVGISIWLLWPTFTGVLVGAALWAAHDAAASGSWEALIHDQLTAVGLADRYQRTMARIGQFSHVGVACGTLLGAALLRVDVGLVTLGWITVAAHAGSVSGVLLLPDVDAATGPFRAWWRTLRDGVHDARHTPTIARLVIVGAMLEGVFMLDEYLPLLARARGGADSAAPIIVSWCGSACSPVARSRRGTPTSPADSSVGS